MSFPSTMRSRVPVDCVVPLALTKVKPWAKVRRSTGSWTSGGSVVVVVVDDVVVVVGPPSAEEEDSASVVVVVVATVVVVDSGAVVVEVSSDSPLPQAATTRAMTTSARTLRDMTGTPLWQCCSERTYQSRVRVVGPFGPTLGGCASL